jgi:hypothetical protein
MGDQEWAMGTQATHLIPPAHDPTYRAPMPNPTFTDTPIPRLNEYLQALGRAASSAPVDDQDELLEIATRIEAIKDQREDQVHVKVRTYVFAAIRRAAVETAISASDVPPEEVKRIVLEELNALLSDPTLVDQVMAGTLTQ